MSETAFSSIKRTLGAAVCARSGWLEFRKMILKATGLQPPLERPIFVKYSDVYRNYRAELLAISMRKVDSPFDRMLVRGDLAGQRFVAEVLLTSWTLHS